MAIYVQLTGVTALPTERLANKLCKGFGVGGHPETLRQYPRVQYALVDWRRWLQFRHRLAATTIPHSPQFELSREDCHKLVLLAHRRVKYPTWVKEAFVGGKTVVPIELLLESGRIAESEVAVQ